jgi:hypothetical protein
MTGQFVPTPRAISEGIFTGPRRPVIIRGEMTEQKPNFTEYYREGAACLALAQLTDISSIKVRWLRMAQPGSRSPRNYRASHRDGREETGSE